VNAHDQVIDAILAALQAEPAIAAGNVFEEELRRKPETMDEYVVVRFAGSSPRRVAIRGAPVDWTSLVTIESHARRDQRTPAGRASRRLAAQVYARLMTDPTLSGVVLAIEEPRLDTDSEQLDTELGCVIAQYPVLHRTQARTLESA
jgi:hypothetical protein